jgi:hypothetical protein
MVDDVVVQVVDNDAEATEEPVETEPVDEPPAGTEPVVQPPTTTPQPVVPALPVTPTPVYEQVTAPAMPDPADVSEWYVEGIWQLTSTDLGPAWTVTGSEVASSLIWIPQLNLSGAPEPQLRLQTRGTAPVILQTTTDGTNWSYLGHLPASETWVTVSFDLTAYRSQSFWIRWTLPPQNSGERLIGAMSFDAQPIAVSGPQPAPAPTQQFDETFPVIVDPIGPGSGDPQ